MHRNKYFCIETDKVFIISHIYANIQCQGA
jgi:hypothetical protein